MSKGSVVMYAASFTDTNADGPWPDPGGVYVYACPSPDDPWSPGPMDPGFPLPSPEEMKQIALGDAVIIDLLKRLRALEQRVLELEKVP